MNNKIPVSFNLNTPQNRLLVNVDIVSDVVVCPVSFYENNGLYWFCLEHSVHINSVSFVSLRNCVSAFKATCHSLGFDVRDVSSLNRFVLGWEKCCKSKKGVA